MWRHRPLLRSCATIREECWSHAGYTIHPHVQTCMYMYTYSVYNIQTSMGLQYISQEALYTYQEPVPLSENNANTMLDIQYTCIRTCTCKCTYMCMCIVCILYRLVWDPCTSPRKCCTLITRRYHSIWNHLSTYLHVTSSIAHNGTCSTIESVEEHLPRLTEPGLLIY